MSLHNALCASAISIVPVLSVLTHPAMNVFCSVTETVELKKVFDEIDTDHSGFIDAAEVTVGQCL